MRIVQISSHQFRSLSNLLEALIKGDYSLRARSDEKDSALDELIDSINGLAERLTKQRQESTESQLLLATVIAHIDVAIIALSSNNSINFVNPAAEKLLLIDEGSDNPDLIEQLGSTQQYTAGYNHVIELSFGQQSGKFNVHIEEFRETGLQQKLLFITDVSTLLRSEERKAWQNLVRVISHEINNSLAPIVSISQTLNRQIAKKTNTEQIAGDLVEGLTIIAERANSLSHFVNSYEQLAKLPEPLKQTTSLNDLIEKVSLLFKDQLIEVHSSLATDLQIDPIQFEQVIINIIKNSVESIQQTGKDGKIYINWSVEDNFFRLSICDEGVGILNSENLFVPFYTTKQRGTGIGLVLCRQIIEAHNGKLILKNKKSGSGCCAIINLPLPDIN
jgi:nitrogen fixation/metabolism regulation signal transduction histidine kinase